MDLSSCEGSRNGQLYLLAGLRDRERAHQHTFICMFEQVRDETYMDAISFDEGNTLEAAPPRASQDFKDLETASSIGPVHAPGKPFFFRVFPDSCTATAATVLTRNLNSFPGDVLDDPSFTASTDNTFPVSSDVTAMSVLDTFPVAGIEENLS